MKLPLCTYLTQKYQMTAIDVIVWTMRISAVPFHPEDADHAEEQQHSRDYGGARHFLLGRRERLGTGDER